jgi:hypothetical protein
MDPSAISFIRGSMADFSRQHLAQLALIFRLSFLADNRREKKLTRPPYARLCQCLASCIPTPCSRVDPEYERTLFQALSYSDLFGSPEILEPEKELLLNMSQGRCSRIGVDSMSVVKVHSSPF